MSRRAYAQPTFPERLREHARAEGGGRVALRMARWALGAAVPRGGDFTLGGETYQRLRHAHKLTWTTERAVEVPVARRVVERHPGKRILEVGNVLSHYGTVAHEVVDKYETAPGVRNVDVLDLEPERRYDLIVSISTLEHVGRDEHLSDPTRAADALAHLQSLVAPGGKLFATVPAGYNRALEERLRADTAFKLRAMRRGPWREIDPAEAFECPYDFLVYRASAVLFVEADSLR